MTLSWPPQIIAAFIVCLVALLAMMPSLIKQFSTALLERSAAESRRKEADAVLMQARAAEMQAAAAMRIAEAKAREAESKITVGDREELRRERRGDRREIAELRDRLDIVEKAFRESETRRVSAETARDAMRAQFAQYAAEVNAHEVRAGRPPKATPPAFRSVDITQPYALEKAT